MIGYNPSHLNKNETLLEAFHRVESYLKANPQYQVYQSSAQYQDDTQEYTLNTIIVPEGSKVSAGDVVLFSNVYYAVITAVYELTFSVEYATNFRGEKGEKGDSGVGNAKLSNTPGTSDTDGYTQKAVNGIVQNPNLLINPNFAINQRGQSSYSGSVYGVDRWKGIGAITATPVANGIQLSTSGTSNIYIKQIVETNLAGKTVTATCKLSAINSGEGGRFAVYYSTNGTSWTLLDGMTITATGISKLTVTVPSNAVYVSVDVGVRPSSNVVFEWAKLEIGSVATEFSPPSIAEELPKCYRYYKKIMNLQKQDYVGLGIVYGDDSGARMLVDNTFRTNPTSTIAGAFTVVVNGEYRTVSAIATQSFNSTNIVVKFTLDSAVTNGVCGYLLSNNSPSAYIAFDAEL